MDEQNVSCVISFFYIKPQLEAVIGAGSDRCVISFFYIKPQPRSRHNVSTAVALYLSSTSNHNYGFTRINGNTVALYLSSTSNHNLMLNKTHRFSVALYLSSTSNHNQLCLRLQVCQVALYLSSTSNHNNCPRLMMSRRLRYIFLLHQTTTKAILQRI